MEADSSKDTCQDLEKQDSEEHEVEHQLLPPRHRGNREYANGTGSSSSISFASGLLREPVHHQASPQPFQSNAAYSRQSDTPSDDSGGSSATGHANVPHPPTAAPFHSAVSLFPTFPGIAPPQFPIGIMPFTPFYNPAFGPVNQQQAQFFMALADIYRMNPGWTHPPISSPNPSHPSPSHSPTRSSSHEISTNLVQAEKTRERSPKRGSPYSLRHSQAGSSSHKGKGRATEAAPTSSASDVVFVTQDGNPLTFFVQMEVKNRQTIISKIRKHGGLIKVTQEEADYSILYPGSKTFRASLKEAAATNAIAKGSRPHVAQPSQINDVPPAPENWSPPVPVPQVQRQLTTTSKRFEEPVLLQQAQRTGQSPYVKEEATSTSAVSSSKTMMDSRKIRGPPEREATEKTKTSSLQVARRDPSPTPPPLPAEPPQKGKRFEYTEAEKEYALRYAQALFSRDHEMPTMTLARKLHNKLPHHTAPSWNTFITSRTMRGDIEAIRKRAGITFRKQLHAHSMQECISTRPQVKQEDVEEQSSTDRPLKRQRTDKRHDAQPRPQHVSSELQDDFEAIVDFFLRWNSTERALEDDETEDAAWAALTKEATCKTEESWGKFYELHHVEVNARYDFRKTKS
uniref:BRCT domain-containing protein n=1 Tax=Moniliophthora roreri TaxID=221103 RepID=A0A0W0F5P2_MONRR